ncbi:MAG: hypothetical protein ACPG4U_08800 [Pseudomonadales bacterium]
MKQCVFQTQVAQYIAAKDNNKPHLMGAVFKSDARLEMLVQTENIDFPSQVEGRAAITATLVRNFNRQFENVYTFCIEDALQVLEDHYCCPWFVCMNDIASGELKVGYGYYRWYFAGEEDGREKFSRLVIEIESMSVFPPEYAHQCYEWLAEIPYPWCEKSQLTIARQSFLTDLQDFVAQL